MTAPQAVLSLPGGGLTGALYQIGALAALEDGVRTGDGGRYQAYIGSSSGASVAGIAHYELKLRSRP